MGDLPRVRPKSRKAWRTWLETHHASSMGTWLVYAKKRSGLPSLTYNDAVEEALCFGWIDSKIHPIARYLQQIIENMARNLSREERMAMAGFRPKGKSTRVVKGSR